MSLIERDGAKPMWDQDNDHTPMTDAEYKVWHAETKAKIAHSLADPRPPLTGEQVREHFERRLRIARSATDDAA